MSTYFYVLVVGERPYCSEVKL